MAANNMNENIKELWIQAAITISPLKEGAEWQKEFVQKFSYLLLKECLEICEKAGDDGLDGHYAADWISRKFKKND